MKVGTIFPSFLLIRSGNSDCNSFTCVYEIVMDRLAYCRKARVNCYKGKTIILYFDLVTV